ncbi:MAG: type II secretion system protein GspG [marine bacterium B5-7]|nr:MAG: type II secretion system protein GspG [marine bacterium B5-7]
MPADKKYFPGNNRYKHSQYQGFSLVELLVVLVILGLLGGLVAPRVIHHLDAAKVDAARAQIEKLGADLDIFRLNTGNYPARLEDLVEKPSNVSNWNGPYVKRKSLKDPWGAIYIYQFPGEHGDYDLMSLGADGSNGGEGRNGDIANWEL